MHPDDTEAAQAQTQEWKRLLKDEGGWTLLAVWEDGEWPSSEPASERFWTRYWVTSATRRIAWSIPSTRRTAGTSGPVPWRAAARRWCCNRLKGAGMRWSERGAHAVCHVRALYRSEQGQWESFWQTLLATRVLRASVQQQM